MYGIMIDSKIVNCWCESVDNDAFLCEYETEQECDEQLELYSKYDEQENVQYIYNVFRINPSGITSEDLAVDNAQRTAVWEEKEDGLYLIYAPFAWNNKDKEETKQFLEAIKMAKENEHRTFLFCELIKQYQS